MRLAEIGLFEGAMLCNFRLDDNSLRDQIIETYLAGVPPFEIDEALMEFANTVFILRDAVVGILEGKPVPL